MGTKSSCELPHAFYWIKLRAVGRQKLQPEPFPVFLQGMVLADGMMISGIVQNYHNTTASGSVL